MSENKSIKFMDELGIDSSETRLLEDRADEIERFPRENIFYLCDGGREFDILYKKDKMTVEFSSNERTMKPFDYDGVISIVDNHDPIEVIRINNHEKGKRASGFIARYIADPQLLFMSVRIRENEYHPQKDIHLILDHDTVYLPNGEEPTEEHLQDAQGVEKMFCFLYQKMNIPHYHEATKRMHKRHNKGHLKEDKQYR